MSTPVTVEMRYGLPGVLVTSGVALLVVSVLSPAVNPALSPALIPAIFRLGSSLLFLGILGFIMKQLLHDLNIIDWDNMESGARALFALYVLALIGLGVVVFLLFRPLLQV